MPMWGEKRQERSPTTRKLPTRARPSSLPAPKSGPRGHYKRGRNACQTTSMRRIDSAKSHGPRAQFESDFPLISPSNEVALAYAVPHPLLLPCVAHGARPCPPSSTFLPHLTTTIPPRGPSP